VSGLRNVQPDLLCGPDRFPSHLDAPSTVDVAVSSQGAGPSDFNQDQNDGPLQAQSGAQQVGFCTCLDNCNIIFINGAFLKSIAGPGQNI